MKSAGALPCIESLERRTLLAAVKILPLGDSITEGWNTNTNVTYRFWLWKKLQLAGYEVDFVGTKTGVFAGSPAYTDWDQAHQGTAGQLAEQTAAGATTWANATQPDIVLLHIGTNDLLQSEAPANTINDVKSIIDNLRVARPSVTILLAKIIPSTINASAFAQFNGLIDGVVAQKTTAQSPVIAVDHATGFSASADNFDGIHPNARGERKMSNKWFATLATLLPAPAPAPPAVTYLSDLSWTSMTNGFGPAELDQSIGGNGTDDGGPIWLQGTTYPKGLGTHATSQITYNLSGQYARFLASVGIDDDAGSQGSSVFQVFVDNLKLYDSGTMTGNSATKQVDVPVAGASQLKLVVTDAGDGENWDHGDWAMARLTTQPTVASSSFAFATAPHALRFTFRGNVSSSLSTSDLTVMNLSTSTPVPTASIALSNYNTTTNEATFIFPGFSGGVLPDGNYRATVIASGITDAAGNPMPANHQFDYFFQMGDADHNGLVNTNDFTILAANFGQSNRNFTHGDFNYDGLVNTNDFTILASRFGDVLPASISRFRSVGRSSLFGDSQIDESRGDELALLSA